LWYGLVYIRVNFLRNGHEKSNSRKKTKCTSNIQKRKEGAFCVKEINKCRLMLASTIAYISEEVQVS
jgi:hypothetical protein